MTQEEIKQICDDNWYFPTIVIMKSRSPIVTEEVPNPETPEQYAQRYLNELELNK